MEAPRQEYWNLPNAISSLRIIAGVPVILLLVQGENWALWTALGVMIAAELSDWLDGFVARKQGRVSHAGKLLDPMADSLYRMSVFTAFSANHWMPLWMLLVVVGRDVGVSYLRLIAEQNIGTLGARQSGKWKAMAQGAAQMTVVAAYASWGHEVSRTLEMGLTAVLMAAVLVTAYSFADYAVSVTRALSGK